MGSVQADLLLIGLSGSGIDNTGWYRAICLRSFIQPSAPRLEGMSFVDKVSTGGYRRAWNRVETLSPLSLTGQMQCDRVTGGHSVYHSE